MVVTLDLPPQVEAAYRAEAQARGLPLAQVVRETLILAQPYAAIAELNTEQWVSKFSAWLATHAGDNVVLPDDAMERESIYGDHGW